MVLLALVAEALSVVLRRPPRPPLPPSAHDVLREARLLSALAPTPARVPGVLAATGNYRKGYGWQRGQPWGEGTANFQVLLQWNASQVYTKTVAYFAEQLASGE